MAADRFSAVDVVALVTVGMCAAMAPAQPTIINLGVLSGGNPTYAYAEAISADGLVVTGSSSSAAGQAAFRWAEVGGMQSMGALSGFAVRSTGQALSANGSVITGSSTGANNTGRGFRWTAGTGMQSIGVVGSGSASYGRAISADGSVIAGSSYTAGFTGFTAMRWTAATGMQPIGAGAALFASAISADGTVIGGSGLLDGFFRGFRWTAAGGTPHLSILTGADSGEVTALSADGSIAAGYSGDQFNGTYQRGTRWTGIDGGGAGEIQNLDPMGSAEFSYANAISGDGTVVGGARSVVGGDHAFAWSAALGMVDLNTYLPMVGADITGWTLTVVRGISFDGSSMVGYGTYNGADRAFLVRGLSLGCPALCAADFNCSHTLEVQDIFDFLNAWFGSDARADFNGGGLSVQDIFDFLNAWFMGC